MKIQYLLALTIVVLLTSCSKDEPASVASLSGTINNEAFEIGQSTYTVIEDNLQFNIFSNTSVSDDACTELPEGIRIFFKAKNSLDKQDLFLDNNSFEAFTVSIFDVNQAEDIIITEGSFQIIEMKDDNITGDIELKSDNGTSLKGRFISLLCE